MLNYSIEEVIERVREMEKLFDEVLQESLSDRVQVRDEEMLRKKMEILEDYYENGLWMYDFQCDEQGELPKDLKRGVLSEDGLYNLLTDRMWQNEEWIEAEDII